MAEEEKKEISEEQAAEQLKKTAEGVDKEKVEEMVSKEDKLKGFFKHVEPLKKYWDDICEVFSLLKDSVSRKYTDVPWTTIASLTGALLYVLNPFDCVWDMIPLVGFLDDALVVALALKFTKDDRARYRAWREALCKQDEVTHKHKAEDYSDERK